MFPQRNSPRWSARQSSRLAAGLEPEVKAQKRAYRKAVRRVQRKFSESTVHELRVQTRRMLALLDLLAPYVPLDVAERDRRALRKVLKRFTNLRDTQVVLIELENLSLGGNCARPFRKWLERRETRMIARCQRNVPRSDAAEAGHTLSVATRNVRRRFDAPAGATDVLTNLLGRVDSAFAEVITLRHRINRRQPKTIHRTRIAFKRFRYMAEWLARVLPGISKRQLRQMHDLQGEMGALQDCEVLLERFAKFSRKHEVDPADSLQFRVKVERRRARLLTGFLAHVNDLYKFWAGPLKRAAQDPHEPIQAPHPSP